MCDYYYTVVTQRQSALQLQLRPRTLSPMRRVRGAKRDALLSAVSRTIDYTELCCQGFLTIRVRRRARNLTIGRLAPPYASRCNASLRAIIARKIERASRALCGMQCSCAGDSKAHWYFYLAIKHAGLLSQTCRMIWAHPRDFTRRCIGCQLTARLLPACVKAGWRDREFISSSWQREKSCISYFWSGENYSTLTREFTTIKRDTVVYFCCSCILRGSRSHGDLFFVVYLSVYFARRIHFVFQCVYARLPRRILIFTINSRTFRKRRCQTGNINCEITFLPGRLSAFNRVGMIRARVRRKERISWLEWKYSFGSRWNRNSLCRCYRSWIYSLIKLGSYSEKD